MSFSDLGNEIKALRKHRGFSQKELSDGICSQAQISKIEKGDVYPLATTLYDLSARLGVDINFFFDRVLVERLDYVEEVYAQIREAIGKYDYEKVNELVQTEKKNPHYEKYLLFRQFIMWHEGICLFHLYDRLDEAIVLLEDAFQLTYTEKYYSEREIEILNSKGVFLLISENYNEAVSLYETLLEEHEKLKTVKDPKIRARLYYNLAKGLNHKEWFEESNEVCEKGIQYCIHTSNMYQFGHFHFQIGYNLYKMGRIEECRPYFEDAHKVFELQRNKQLKEHVEVEFLSKWDPAYA